MDIKNKTIVITGGSSGIGAAAARLLTKMQARVVITGRSTATKQLAEELKCDYFLVDYSSYASVKAFAAQLLEKYPVIDVLVNNVGGIIATRRLTGDGHEQTLQVNHLSGFLLTHLLKERLEESKALVINTSSIANMFGKVDFSDLQNAKAYQAMKAYGSAKLMNILHAMEINRRFKGVRAASFHPGTVETGFAREGGGFLKWAYESWVKQLFLISPEKGADTLVWLITSTPEKEWKTGEYYYKRKPGRKNAQVKAEVASQLWEESVKLLGLKQNNQ